MLLKTQKIKLTRESNIQKKEPSQNQRYLRIGWRRRPAQERRGRKIEQKGKERKKHRGVRKRRVKRQKLRQNVTRKEPKTIV